MAETKSSEITSRPPLVDLTKEAAAAPGIVYIGRDDRLYIRSSSTGPGATVIVSGRLLHADGAIRPFRFDVATGANFTVAIETRDLAEGYLLSVAATVAGAGVQAFHLSVEVGILRGRLADRHIVHVLFRDYLSTSLATGWPPGRIAPSLEWPGHTIGAGITDPAAGAESSFAAAANSVVTLDCFRVTLVTDATVASRQVALEFVRAGAVVWRSPFFDAQTASLTRVYNWAVGSTFEAAARNGEYTGTMPRIYLLETEIVRTNTLALQAGDDYGLGQMSAHRWTNE